MDLSLSLIWISTQLFPRGDMMDDYEYLKAMLRYKKWERSLKGLTKEEREKILKGYQIRKPSRGFKDITYRALEDYSL